MNCHQTDCSPYFFLEPEYYVGIKEYLCGQLKKKTYKKQGGIYLTFT